MWWFSWLLAGYVWSRGVLPWRCRWWWKAALLPVLALGAAHFRLLRLPVAAEFPPGLLLLSAWLLAICFWLCPLLLLRDLFLLGCLAARRCGRTPAAWWRRREKPVAAGMLVLAVGLATIGLSCGLRAPRWREMELTLPRLSAAGDGLTLAVLSDLHVDLLTPSGRVRELVRQTNARKPDLILLLGDLVDLPVSTRAAEELRALGELRAPLGVYAVPGNHEYYSNYRNWRPFLAGLGVVWLENEHRWLPESGLAVAGVTDAAGERFGLPGPDLHRALAGLPEASPVVLLAHRPELAVEAAPAGVSLQLSGHTHGGLICGLDRLVAAFNHGWVRGCYQVGELTLFVSSGAGIWGGFPVRLGTAPELTLLRLRSPQQAESPAPGPRLEPAPEPDAGAR